jgi:hypothetical protein
LTLSAATTWEIRTTGADTNGGGFVAGAAGTDRSGADTAFAGGTNLTVDATTNTDVTPDGYTPVAADVGNIIQITTTGGGAAFTVGFYQIASIQAGKWRLDRSPAATSSAGATWALGGALATPGKAGAGHVGGNVLHLRSGTYISTLATVNVAGGCLSLAAGITANQTRLIGYGSTRLDGGTKPVLLASGITAFTLITTATGCRVENVSVDGASLTNSRGINVSTGGGQAYRCRAANCTNTGFASGTSSSVLLCEATGCSGTGGAFSGGVYFFCVARGNSINGFTVGGFGASCVGCLSVNNTGAANGFSGIQNGHLSDCIAYGNGSHGFSFSAGTNHDLMVNCLAVGNGGAGFAVSSLFDGGWLINCAGFNNAGGNVQSNVPAGNRVGFLTLTADPFTNAAGLDFSPNAAAGGGAVLRAAGIPSAAGLTILPGLATPSYPDVGAVQSQGGGSPGEVDDVTAQEIIDEVLAGIVTAHGAGSYQRNTEPLDAVATSDAVLVGLAAYPAPTQAQMNARTLLAASYATAAVADAIKLKTDLLSAGPAGSVNANVTHVNEVLVVGAGVEGVDPWGPA